MRGEDDRLGEEEREGRAAGRGGVPGLNENRRREAEEWCVERNTELRRTRGLNGEQRRETGADRAKRSVESRRASGPGDGR